MAMRSRFATSNPNPSGIKQGTLGGKPAAAGMRPGSRSLNVGDEMYVWILVGLEVATMAILRKKFRRHHGG